MRVLLAEDEPKLCEQIKKHLSAEGRVVDVTNNGTDALHMGATEPYDMIILDIGLPERDGISVLREWRSAGVKIPVLIPTARDGWSERVDGLDAGADDYMTKPFHMPELAARVRAILTPPGPEKNALLDEAVTMADQARRLAPTDPWAQSAQAWVKFANREFDEAMRISTRAATLAPDDEHVLDIHGSIALFSGHFAEAASSAAKAMNGGRSNQRFANRNIFGAANFHLDNYEKSLDSFSAAAEYGDPISAPSFAYQTAALYELGNTKEAARKYAELRKSWPDADVGKMLAGIFRDPSHVEKVMRSIRSLDNSSD